MLPLSLTWSRAEKPPYSALISGFEHLLGVILEKLCFHWHFSILSQELCFFSWIRAEIRIKYALPTRPSALGESPYIIAAKRSASTDISLCSCLALARQRHKEDNPEKTFKWDFELSPIRLIAVPDAITRGLYLAPQPANTPAGCSKQAAQLSPRDAPLALCLERTNR